MEGKSGMGDKAIALISGAAQGIGLACAQALAEDGFNVILADVKDSVTEVAAQLGGTGYICDFADSDAILALFDRVETEHGKVSALVNNAGIVMPGDFLSYELSSFDAVLNLNLRGLFVAMQRAARSMVDTEIEGTIVNISSVNAQVAIPAIPAYCASKGAVMQLTKAAALALAKNNIRVNAVGPGSIPRCWRVSTPIQELSRPPCRAPRWVVSVGHGKSAMLSRSYARPNPVISRAKPFMLMGVVWV